jgi:hypothetical protein
MPNTSESTPPADSYILPQPPQHVHVDVLRRTAGPKGFVRGTTIYNTKPKPHGLGMHHFVGALSLAAVDQGRHGEDAGRAAQNLQA